MAARTRLRKEIVTVEGVDATGALKRYTVEVRIMEQEVGAPAGRVDGSVSVHVPSGKEKAGKGLEGDGRWRPVPGTEPEYVAVGTSGGEKWERRLVKNDDNTFCVVGDELNRVYRVV